MKKNKTDNNPRVLGYCRVSTTMQGEEGDSLDAQEEQIKRFCKNNNLILDGVFKETISGAIHPENRPLLRHILREIENGSVQGLVVYKLDRLSRSIKDTIELVSKFNDNDWCFFEIKHGLNTHGAVGKFQILIFSALHELERSQIQERVNEIIAYKREKNELLGGIPFGKDVVEKDGVKILVDNEDEMRCIDRIFELRDELVKDKKGRVRPRSRLDICRMLEREGFKNKQGESKFYCSTVSKILREREKYVRVNDKDIGVSPKKGS